ncbi:hypothetical protein JKP88DRAFT_246029 [Tribonema minus]|uniref:RWP-RK domain-containing protein n=1 Tax=Tribonema minus TaxID=303371 RepID=A0A835YUN4_9STRA|nr:hypothetical protein JKP88DRAFT_246029 [Tribonema minus]
MSAQVLAHRTAECQLKLAPPQRSRADNAQPLPSLSQLMAEHCPPEYMCAFVHSTNASRLQPDSSSAQQGAATAGRRDKNFKSGSGECHTYHAARRLDSDSIPSACQRSTASLSAASTSPGRRFSHVVFSARPTGKPQQLAMASPEGRIIRIYTPPQGQTAPQMLQQPPRPASNPASGINYLDFCSGLPAMPASNYQSAAGHGTFRASSLQLVPMASMCTVFHDRPFSHSAAMPSAGAFGPVQHGASSTYAGVVYSDGRYLLPHNVMMHPADSAAASQGRQHTAGSAQQQGRHTISRLDALSAVAQQQRSTDVHAPFSQQVEQRSTQSGRQVLPSSGASKQEESHAASAAHVYASGSRSQQDPESTGSSDGESSGGGGSANDGGSRSLRSGARDWNALSGFHLTGVIDVEMVRLLFHLPLVTAADRVGICVTALKKICRKHGIMRWPYRGIKALEKTIESLRSASMQPQVHQNERLRYQQQMQRPMATVFVTRHLNLSKRNQQ